MPFQEFPRCQSTEESGGGGTHSEVIAFEALDLEAQLGADDEARVVDIYLGLIGAAYVHDTVAVGAMSLGVLLCHLQHGVIAHAAATADDEQGIAIAGFVFFPAYLAAAEIVHG